MTKFYAIADRAADGSGPKCCTRGLEAPFLSEEDPQKYEACDAVLDEQWFKQKTELMTTKHYQDPTSVFHQQQDGRKKSRPTMRQDSSTLMSRELFQWYLRQ
jgi:hypothetical protein